MNWLDTDEEHCQAFMSMTLMRINWSMNFTSEVLSKLFQVLVLDLADFLRCSLSDSLVERTQG